MKHGRFRHSLRHFCDQPRRRTGERWETFWSQLWAIIETPTMLQRTDPTKLAVRVVIVTFYLHSSFASRTNSSLDVGRNYCKEPNHIYS